MYQDVSKQKHHRPIGHFVNSWQRYYDVNSEFVSIVAGEHNFGLVYFTCNMLVLQAF